MRGRMKKGGLGRGGDTRMLEMGLPEKMRQRQLRGGTADKGSGPDKTKKRVDRGRMPRSKTGLAARAGHAGGGVLGGGTVHGW